MRIFSSKKTGGLVIAALAVSLALVPVVKTYAGWGPTRPTFTWAHPATYNTFDSITDNPTVGDERPFLSGKDTAASGNVVDKLNVYDNEEISLRVFYHNDAAANLNLVATNTRVRIALPKTPSTATWATGHISADNASPKDVADTVDFVGSQLFTVAYEPGSAQIWNNSRYPGTVSDDIVGPNGALIGFAQNDGKIHGCSNFSGFVTIKVRVHMQTQPQTPVYSCNLLTLTQDANDIHKYNGSVTYTAQNGASLTNVNWSWGDGSSDNTGTTTTKSHTYAKDDTYKVVSTLTFDVNGDTKSVSSESCSKTITISTPPVTPPTTPPQTPPAPTQLPNTGAGSVVGIFAGVSALAGAAHYILSGRRNSVRG